MVDEQTLIKLGLTKDEDNIKLKEVLKDNINLKEIHIDIYPESPLITSSLPFMLLSRIIEKNVAVSNDNNRLILKKNDTYKTYFMNVLFSEINECFFKISDYSSEFILNIRNIYYIITILN